MTSQTTPPQIIQRCIDRVRVATDARSAAQLERRCRERLGNNAIAADCAAAARRIGEWLAARTA